MTRGTTATWNLHAVLAGAPVDLAGKDLRWTAKAYRGDTDAVITKTSDDGILLLDAAAGLAQVQLYPADTLSCPAERDVDLVWDLWLVGAESYLLDSGLFTVAASVGQPSDPA